ncbi:MAG: SufD family Fe-S cluster assembly protein [Mycoplasmataceae bacterium]|jgi:hypothetical protein|nr:SufD family Fe-S cluster assembly protein [Mycoplasmataceae bacterium]
MFKKEIKYIFLKDEKIEITINSDIDIYFLILNQNVDIKLIHLANAKCNIHVNVIAKDKDLNIKLNSIVNKNEKNTELHQYLNGYCLKHSSINFEPVMDINNNVINVSHEIVLGDINKDILFYLNTKNYDTLTARSVFLNSIFLINESKNKKFNEFFKKLIA